MKIVSSVTVLVLLTLVVPTALFAQAALRGLVTDSLTHEALYGANVYLKGTPLGGVTDREGKFSVARIPEGTFTVRVSYVGYKPKDVSMTFSATEPRQLTVQLVPDIIEGEEVVITGQLRGQVAAINQQLTSNTIVNVVSEEKIKELPDANAAEAIGRLPGVSLIRSGGEANKVILRGMDDKFTSFTIDGIRIAPTDSNSRGLDLSTFSQGTLAGVELYKALTADKDADAIAGSINLVTRKAPLVREIRVDAKGGYNKLNNTYGQYDFSGKYGERFLDGILGVQATGNLERRDRSNEQINLSLDGSRRNYTDFLITDFTVGYIDETRKRGGAGLLLDLDTPDSGSIRINNIFNQTNRNFVTYSRDYPNGGEKVFYSVWDREEEISTFNSSIRGNNYLFDFNVNWGLAFAQSKTDFPYDYKMKFGEPPIPDSSGMATIPESAWKGPPELFTQYAYNNFKKATLDTAFYNSEKNLDKERTAFLDLSKEYTLGNVASGQLKFGGKYRFRNRFKESGGLMAPYYLNYFQSFTRLPDGTVQPKNFAGTRFANLQLVGRLVLLTNFLDPSPARRDLFDKYNLNPLINQDAAREWYDLNKNGVGTGGTLEYNPDPEVAADFYDIVERISAGYVMNTFNIGQIATFIAGVRAESETNDYLAKYVNTPLGGFPTTGKLLDTTSHFTETTWLPNFHLIVRPTDFMTVRFAGYRALARPDFNLRLDKMVARVTNPRNTLVIGNPGLKNAKAWNYEINTSFYGKDLGLFSISAFYKEITDMFHVVYGIPGVYKAPGQPGSLLDTLGITWRPAFPVNSPISVTYPTNSAQPTKVWGFEFEHQANLSFLPGLLSNTILSYNFSIVRSETFVLSYRVDTTYIVIPGFPPLPQYSTVLTTEKQKLEGQPEFFGNVALGYDIGGFSGRVSVFYQGEYNRSYSASRRSDPVVQSFSRWDVSLKQLVTQNIAVFFNLNNFTSVEEQVFTANRVAGWETLNSNQRYGLTGDLGVRLTF